MATAGPDSPEPHQHELPAAATGPRYPETQLPVVAELPERWRAFSALREELLLGYGYQTARAYWGDLQHIAEWADERGLDVLQLTEAEIRRYLALLRRRKYSESTVRRRVTSLRAFYAVVVDAGVRFDCPAANVVVRRRR